MPSSLQTAVDYLARVDPVLAEVIATHSLPAIEPHGNYYQELVESIISQQLSVKAADTIRHRFIDLFAGDTFPTPAQILTKSIDEFRAVGLSRQKAGYIQDLAAKVQDGTVTFDHLDRLSNDEIIRELTAIKGVGTWTVHMFLIFCMGRLDVLPVGDLGIKNGIQKLYKLPTLPSAEDMEYIATKQEWHPYESIASWYIWQALDNKPAL